MTLRDKTPESTKYVYSPSVPVEMLREQEIREQSGANTIQDCAPNFRGSDGKLYLVRCYACDPKRGRENYAPSVATGTCAWCGWSEAVKP